MQREEREGGMEGGREGEMLEMGWKCTACSVYARPAGWLAWDGLAVCWLLYSRVVYVCGPGGVIGSQSPAAFRGERYVFVCVL